MILHPGDLTGPWKYAYGKIKRLLEKHGATLGDIAKMVTYMTDVRYQPDYGKCRVEAFGSHPLPAHTLRTISQLAWPGMIVEIDVTAIVPLKEIAEACRIDIARKGSKAPSSRPLRLHRHSATSGPAQALCPCCIAPGHTRVLPLLSRPCNPVNYRARGRTANNRRGTGSL